jgi:hypothetical protein
MSSSAILCDVNEEQDTPYFQNYFVCMYILTDHDGTLIEVEYIKDESDFQSDLSTSDEEKR